MKIKIKKQDKVKEFKLISNWEDVTLENWISLINFKAKTKSGEALETISTLSNIPKELINQLELQDVSVILNKIAVLQHKQNSTLKNIIKIDGVEYGFHPDLDSITLGEYADIESLIKEGIENNLPSLMAVLYRPVKDKGENGVYTIEAYDGNITIRADQIKKMSAEQVQSALVFFYLFVRELQLIFQSSLIQELMETKKQLQMNPLQKSGGTLE